MQAAVFIPWLVLGVVGLRGEGAVGQEAAGGPQRQRSVLVVTLDTARRDFMGFHGRAPSPTPWLDRLAAESVVFEDAYTVAPLTLPAHASLFTGLLPRSHGVHDNSAAKLPQSARTLAEILKERGYATGAAVAAFVLDRMFGLDQGFERYDSPEVPPSGAALVPERPAAAMVTRALADLAELAPRAPFLYWLHLYDPHFPYRPPGAPLARPAFVGDEETWLRAQYEQEIRQADAELGRLFDELRRRGQLDDLVILFASDHGESLRDALEPTHGYFLFDPTVRIPLLLRAPGFAPRRIAAQVSLADVMPTLLDLLGIEAPELRFDGLDLAPLLRDPALEPPERALLLESWYPWIGHGWSPFLGCVQGPLKHLRSRRLELFDRATDATERTNAFDPESAASKAMARRLDELFADGSSRLERDALSLSGRDLARLLALGYAAGSDRLAGEPPDFATLPDAYEKLPVIQALEAVMAARVAGDAARETDLLRELVASEPQSASLRESLGVHLVNLGPDHHDEAEKQLRAAIRLEPKLSRSHFALGVLLEQRAARLREEIRREREAGRAREEMQELIQQERQQTRRAVRSYRTCLEFEANFPEAIEKLARLLSEEADRAARAGELGDAREDLREAGELLERWLSFMPPDDPARAQIENNKAWVKRRRDELEQGR